MRVAVGADHASVLMKALVVEELEDKWHEPLDLETHGMAAVDYPDYPGVTSIRRGRGRAATPRPPA